MDASATKEAAVEVCEVLDRLTALSLDIACHGDHPPEQLVLSAADVRESCETISEAVASLKRILMITEAHGGGLIPARALRKFEAAGRN
ncbi:MAG: hypothetical protein ABI920_02930 [Casimicrobiaceae bacterium]